MGEIEFSKNFNDLSIQQGVNAGFQFEFYCEGCHDTFRSEFVPFASARASGWLGKATSIFGGALGGVGRAVEGVAESGWGKAHDQAFVQAIERAKKHFHRCARCSSFVCDTCWNADKGLCRSCAPDVEVAIEAARAQGEAQAAGERAGQEGARLAEKRDVQRKRQLVCPKCGAETKGAKFCPQCGQKLAVTGTCPKCSAEVAPGAKFCPECGQSLQA